MLAFIRGNPAWFICLLLGGGLSACGSLDPAGVYHGDQVLYNADLALGSSYDVLHGFVEWEFQNRAALTNTPAIRRAADQVRDSAPAWFGSALALRDAYQANPTAMNQSSLQQALAVVQQAVVEAVKYMATPLPQTPATTPKQPSPL